MTNSSLAIFASAAARLRRSPPHHGSRSSVPSKPAIQRGVPATVIPAYTERAQERQQTPGVIVCRFDQSCATNFAGNPNVGRIAQLGAGGLADGERGRRALGN
jgi:hypothetical protein